MMQVALIIAYPLWVHLSVWLQLPFMQVLAILSLAVGILFKGLILKDNASWVIFGLVALSSVVLGLYNSALYVLYIPPIIIPLLFLSVFAQSLLPGRIPLVTDIGEKARGPLTQEIRIYTRRVTILWSVVFLIILVGSILLPWLASDFVWSLFTNVLNYAVIGVLFAGEYVYRRKRFRNHNHPSFVEYLKIVIAARVVSDKRLRGNQ